MDERHHYFDWLRILAIFFIIFFHATHAFVNNEYNSTIITASLIIYVWTVPALFFIGGAVTFLSIQKVTYSTVLKKRAKQLLIPVIAGFFTIVPFQAYIYYLGDNFQFLSFFDVWLIDLKRVSFSPLALVEWLYHLWFLVVLFLFIFLLYAIKRFVSPESEKKAVEWLKKRTNKYTLFLFVLPVFFAQMLRVYFPRFFDWPDMISFFLAFLLGYIVIQDEHFLNIIKKSRKNAIIGVVIPIAYIFAYFLYVDFYDWLWNGTFVDYVIPLFMLSLFGFSALIVVISLAMEFLSESNSFLEQFAPIGVAIYILHHPIVVLLEYLIIPLSLPVIVKYLLVSLLTLIITVPLCFFVCRFKKMRVLFGIRR